MSAEEQKIAASEEGLQLREKEKIANPAALLKTSLDGLTKFGGFQLLKGLIKGMDNMDPRRKARKDDFLRDPDYAEDRAAMKNELELWVKLLESGEKDALKMMETCEDERSSKERNLSENLFAVHDEIKDLEVAYRGLDSFFANAGQGKVNCITLMNINKAGITTYDSDDTNAIRSALKEQFDVLDLRRNYSMLVLPGYFGNADAKRGADAMRMWSETAYKNKVMLITDFRDCEDYDELKMRLEKADLQSQEAKAGNVIMTANYILGRKKSELAGEDEDLYIPASGALAGKMSNVDDVVLAQAAAGVKYGTLDNVLGARMKLLKSEIASLIDLGVVPMVEEFGRTMAFSNRTLYNGASLGFKEYSIVRVFDWIGKVFEHFCNQHVGALWTVEEKTNVKNAIQRFLDENKGPGGIIEKCSDLKVEQDPTTRDIKINVRITPYFAAQNFFIELKGKNNKDQNYEWDQKNKAQ